jgi:hypothetical protein
VQCHPGRKGSLPFERPPSRVTRGLSSAICRLRDCSAAMVKPPLCSFVARPQRESSYRKRESSCATGDALPKQEHGRAKGDHPADERETVGPQGATVDRSHLLAFDAGPRDYAHDLGCTARRSPARVLDHRVTNLWPLGSFGPSRETAAAPGAALESASALLPCVGGRHRMAVVYSGLQNQELAYHSWSDDHDHAGSVGRMDQLRGDAVAGGEFGNVGHRDLAFLDGV